MLLRALFVWRHPLFTGDALVYGELAHHMLKEHVYGLMDAGVLKPTLIRLPGYPLFLAACFTVFGDGNYVAVLWVQVVVDLARCALMAATAARIAGRRAGLVGAVARGVVSVYGELRGGGGGGVLEHVLRGGGVLCAGAMGDGVERGSDGVWWAAWWVAHCWRRCC